MCKHYGCLVPYYCARDNKSLAFTDCLDEYQNIDVATLTAQTKDYELDGLIDSTGNLTNDRVYIFSGVNDTVVVPGYDFVAAPRLWNSLPLNCRNAPSVNTFKTRLKTFLFASA